MIHLFPGYNVFRVSSPSAFSLSAFYFHRLSVFPLHLSPHFHLSLFFLLPRVYPYTRTYKRRNFSYHARISRRPLINSYLAFVRLTSGAGSSRHCRAKSCPSCTRRLEIAWEFPRISNETRIVGVFVHIWFAESRVNSLVVMQLFNAGINTFVIICRWQDPQLVE